MIVQIADRIRYLRDKLGMTQTDLANRLGISRSAVNSWEMALSSPSLANIMEMTRIFHVSVDYLLTDNAPFYVDISELDAEEREIILKMVDCLKKGNGKS